MNGGPTLDIRGYRRSDGRIGVRNHVLVFPVSYEMNQIAQSIVRQVPEAVTFRNQHGTDQSGDDLTQTLRVYNGFVTHPNVYGVVILSWGHEPYDLQALANAAVAAGKAVELITLRASGGMRQAVQKGVNAATQFVKDSASVLQEPVPLADVILGTECGGSDACSGISANPALGVVTDILVSHGGISILSETTELIGAEHLLAKRAVSKEVGDKLLYIVDRIEKNAMKMGVDIRGAQPAPGNIAGGITTIEEKSLGCIHKAGSAPIQEVIEYGERPTKHGLVVMDTPGHDIEQLTGMVAGGAQVVIFTTGRGTPTGSSIVPVIKVATNTVTFDKMNDNIDINAGTIIDGNETVVEVGGRLFDFMLDVLNGHQTKAEKLGHREFGIYRIGASF
ncbi:UxaA family hydrolase [Alicyclobacillus ferrooxydans]|uniref:UxaA family hydrolase n=1 Tax=Alicyclobacillus ferrooxydans TaxID=471514 RepID=UPI0009F830D6|nr:UxaA family hydrolase [Alicyclobacillus ferrooxydans]